MVQRTRRVEHDWSTGTECKRCGYCKQWKPLIAFSFHRSTWDKLQGRCRACSANVYKGISIPVREHSNCVVCGASLANRRIDAKFCGDLCRWKVSGAQYRKSLSDEKRQAKTARDTLRDKENPDRVKARQAKYRKRNHAARLEATRVWRKNNPNQNQIWRAANRDKTANYRHNRRVREWSNCHGGVGVSEIDWLRLVNRYNACCAYCDCRPNHLQQDHVVPLCRGGRHSIGNILPACPTCNQSKGGSLLIEWKQRLRSTGYASAVHGALMAAPTLCRG